MFGPAGIPGGVTPSFRSVSLTKAYSSRSDDQSISMSTVDNSKSKSKKEGPLGDLVEPIPEAELEEI